MYPGTHATHQPDKAAVIMAGTGRIVTYAEIDDESVRLARVFRAAGLRRGDRVAIVMDNDPRYLTVCWAAHRSGLVYVPVNWHLTSSEMRYIIDNCGAKALVANAACADVAAVLRAKCPSLQVALTLDAEVPGCEDLLSAIAAQPGPPLDAELEGGDMIYSSGTTGRPKGGTRPLTDAHPADLNPRLLAPFAQFGIDKDCRYLVPGAPLYHAAPLRFAMAVTRLGGSNVIMERFDAEAALAAIERHRVTTSQWVPTMFVRLLRLAPETRSRYDLSSQSAAVHAAAPCPKHVKEQMIEWWGPIIHEYYSASEGGGATFISAADWITHKGSVGKAFVGTFHILDETGNELPVGEAGIIHAENAVPVEYLNDPEKTKAAHSAQGWVTVGDMGYLDDEGYLYLTDRKDHMIISGGVNIYPQETEDRLIQHPLVADVAVIGIPNEEFGEEVKAVVELDDPSLASHELAIELVRFCHDALAAYKCPRSIDFEVKLPRAPSGKLYKRRLRDRYWEDHLSTGTDAATPSLATTDQPSARGEP